MRKKKSGAKKARFENAISLGTPPVYLLDRSAILVRVRKPFITWLNELPDIDPAEKMTLDEVNNDPEIYLLPNSVLEDESEEPLDNLKLLIAPKIFESWCSDSSCFPHFETIIDANKWFDWTLISCVWDLSDEPIERDIV